MIAASGYSFAGVDLAGVRLDGDCADVCTGLDLGRATLIGADLRGVGLAGVSLGRADLRGADLSGAHLAGCDLEGADLRGAELSGADLSGAIMRRVNLSGVELLCPMQNPCAGPPETCGTPSFCWDLSDIDWTDAELDGLQMESVDLTGASFIGATLWSLQSRMVADRPPTVANATDFTDALLRDGRFEQIDFEDARFDGATLDRAVLATADLVLASFESASLNRADLERARLRGVAFLYADLTDVSARSADLLYADLRRANARVADFSMASLRDTKLGGNSTSAGVDLTGAVLTGADLSGSNAGNAILNAVACDGTRFDGAQLAHTSMLLAGGCDLRGASSDGTRLTAASPSVQLPVAANTELFCLDGVSLSEHVSPVDCLDDSNVFTIDPTIIGTRGGSRSVDVSVSDPRLMGGRLPLGGCGAPWQEPVDLRATVVAFPLSSGFADVPFRVAADLLITFADFTDSPNVPVMIFSNAVDEDDVATCVDVSNAGVHTGGDPLNVYRRQVTATSGEALVVVVVNPTMAGNYTVTLAPPSGR